MAIDRSKFKTSSAAAMKQADQETEAVVKNKENVNADYLKITPGSNKFRIYPYHPDGGGDTFAEAKVIHWLPTEVAERDSNNNVVNDPKTGKPKLKRTSKPIFNSKIHAGTKKDIVEEYISFAEKIAKETYNDENQRKAFLEPIFGNFAKKVNGITARASWVVYADKIEGTGKKVFGRLEIGKAIKQRLNAIAANESSSEPLGTDPFTDINDGRAIVVIYNKEADKPQDYYITEIDSSFDKVSKMITLYPLTDEDLDKFEKYPSLASMLKNSYKRKDFDNALKGLKMFDDDNELGIFGYDEFLDTADEISQLYPEDGEAAVEAEEVSGDKFDQMNREELKAFIRDNKTGHVVRKEITDDMIRVQLREWELGDEESVEEAVEEKVVSQTESNISTDEAGDLPWEKKTEEATETLEEPKLSTKEKIALMRANMIKK